MSIEAPLADDAGPKTAGGGLAAATAEVGSVDTGRKPSLKPAAGQKTIVNDCVISVATSNGTGSQSANLILLRTIFQMGVPVAGKNMFPSNIQGLPTWFTIRANKDGWTARRADTDVMIAMNPESVVDDIKSLRPGAILIINESLKAFLNREDLVVYLVPFDKLVVTACPDARLRRLVVNMMYVGVLASMLGLEMEEIQKAVGKQFKSKVKAAELNANAAVAAYQWAAENLPKQELYRIERMSGKVEGKVIMEGNLAAALGLLYGGIQFLSWYPITPSSSVCENLISLLAKYRHQADGKATYATVQAEDELGAMAMVVGAGWAGARGATSTSGPGISLMAELAGLCYFAEIPSVIVDVQRMGPSTGLPTRTSQGDIIKAYNLSHGDCRHVLLIPGNMQEAYDFSAQALDLAERLQTLVFVMLDLDLGMNNHMTEPLVSRGRSLDRGKVLDEKALQAAKEFARYRDVDGDGIPYRTVPGTHDPKAAFFTRGTGHTDRATYSEKAEDWKANMDRLARKFDTARKLVPQPVVSLGQQAATELPLDISANDCAKTSAGGAGAKGHFSLVAYGTSDCAVEEARVILREQHGIETDYLRVRGLPPGNCLRQWIAVREQVLIIEQNRDAQLASVLRIEFPELSLKIGSILHYDGLPIDALGIVNAILEKQALNAHAATGAPAVV